MFKINNFSSIEFYLVALACLTLFFMPIYPDEQAIQLIVFRGLTDGINYNNLAYFCQSFNTEIPLFQYPARYVLKIIFGSISSPIFYRLISISIFVLIYIVISKLIHNNLKYVIFLGYIPFSLAMLRPEGLILLLILTSLYIEKREIRFSVYFHFLIFLFLLILHPRTIFLLPIYLYFIGFSKLNLYLKISLILAVLFFEYQTISMYSQAFACPENDHMHGIFNSLRSLDPSQSLYEILKSLFYKLKDISLIINSVFLYKIDGSFPVPVTFVDFWLYKYFSGFVAFIISLILFITIISFISGRYDNKLFLRNLLLLIFICSCFLFQKDRFYEASIIIPLLLIIYNDGFIKPNFLDSCLKFCGVISLLIIVLIGPKFLSKWGPYSQVRPLNSVLILEIEKIYNPTSKNILVDFDTFNYLKNTNSPILINFFYWYSDGLDNGYKGDLSRLKYLYDIGSDGVAVRCDRISDFVQNLSQKLVVDNFRLCFITKRDLNLLFD